MRLQPRTLSEITGEKSLEVVGNIWAPLVELSQDKQIADAVTAKGGNIAKAIKVATTKHKDVIYDMLAALCVDADTGETVTTAQYKKNCSAIFVMGHMTKVLSDPAVVELFTSQSQTDDTSSGSATENTEGRES